MKIDLNAASGVEVSVSDGYFEELDGYFEELEANEATKSLDNKHEEDPTQCNAPVKDVLSDSNHDSNHDSTAAEKEKSYEAKHEEAVNECNADGKEGCGDDVNYDAIRLDIEKSLEVGSVIETLDDAYILYCEYGRMMGFSVKKGQQIYFRRSDIVKMKLYLCSCEGVPDHKASDSKVAVFKKQMWRTNCRARLRLSRRKDGPWTVSCFHKVHNHNLLAPDQSYLLRSSRNLNHARLSVLATLNSAGIRVSKAFRFMEKECGGLQNLGFIRKDAYNNIGRPRRETKIKNVDAQRVMHYLDQRSSEDPLFRWSAQLDDDGRLMNLFYRDARCALDYNLYGDVLSVDTTHKTNKYNLVCAPFVGMNNHRQNILFGMAFLSDETTESFEWLFSTFLLHMEMKEPQVVFSDQSQALINGLDYTFQSAKHRLCQWHINRNATGHFGSLNGNEEFKRTWYRCMNCCETEDEFEAKWRNMIETYNLSDHSWFKKMYNLKRRWASVFSIDRFSGGLHATSWSESTNKTLKGLCRGNTCLYDFVIRYEQVLKDCRERERAEDAMCLGVPGHVVLNNPLLNHAADVYTRRVFNIFHKEFTQASNVYMAEHPSDYSADDLVFHVRVNGFRKGRIVTVQRSTQQFECSCCKFVTHGLFCNHVINIMLLLNIRRLPDRYILKRWTKHAKNKIDELLLCNKPGDDSGVISKMVFVNHVIRIAYDIGLSCNGQVDMLYVQEALRQMKCRICRPNLEPTGTPEKAAGRDEVKVGGRSVRNPPKRRQKDNVKQKDEDEDVGDDEKKGDPLPIKKEIPARKRKARCKAGQPVSVDGDVCIPPELPRPRRSARNRNAVAVGLMTKESPKETGVSWSNDDLGLDFFSSQRSLVNVSAPHVMPYSFESPLKDEEIKLTL